MKCECGEEVVVEYPLGDRTKRTLDAEPVTGWSFGFHTNLLCEVSVHLTHVCPEPFDPAAVALKVKAQRYDDLCAGLPTANRPSTPQAAMRSISDWFDRWDEILADPDHVVQDDLRRWADELDTKDKAHDDALEQAALSFERSPHPACNGSYVAHRLRSRKKGNP